MTDPGTPGPVNAATRETAYRLVSAVVTLLLGVGVLHGAQAALWSEFGLGAVTLVFAIFYSTSSWRTALYALTGPMGLLLGAYGLWKGLDWAIITAAVGQALGVSTAAAKAVQSGGG